MNLNEFNLSAVNFLFDFYEKLFFVHSGKLLPEIVRSILQINFDGVVQWQDTTLWKTKALKKPPEKLSPRTCVYGYFRCSIRGKSFQPDRTYRL